MTEERRVRRENDNATKTVVDGLFDINGKLMRYISKLESDHSATVTAQQAKIDQLEQENRELKAELQYVRSECQTVVGNMEDKLRREYRAEIAISEKKANDNHRAMNETLQWHVSKLENDHKVTEATQQAKIDQMEEDIRDSKAEQREALGNMKNELQREYRAEIAVLEKKTDGNHQIVNETLHRVVEWFVSEIEQSRQQCKNDTSALAEEIQQIKSQEHVTIQNEVIVHNGYQLQKSTHHYRNLGAQYGAMAGEFIGGYAQDVVSELWSRAISLLAKLK